MANDVRPQRDAQKSSAWLTDAVEASNPVRFYEFDRFRLDAKRGLLMRDGQPVAIKPKAFETLLLLVRHHGRLLEKEELMTRLWPDTIVEEANLTQNVFVARKALGESPGEQRFIATVARQGYRFVADVREIAEADTSPNDAAAAAATADATGGMGAGINATVTAGPAPTRQGFVQRRGIVYASAAALLIAVVGTVAALLWRHRSASAAVGPVRSIAVLPFRNGSGDAQDDFFAAGVTEAITTDLASISALRVISRQSAAQFRGSGVPTPQIARLLGVDALVDGAVARSGGRIRVTVQLVHGATDRHLWAQTYDRDLGDVLALQGQLATAVAHAIRVRVTDAERSGLVDRTRVDPEAYAFYLRAKHFVNQRSDAALKRSVELYREAVTRDPTFAAAYGEMAIAYELLGHTMTPAETERVVVSAAHAALARDPRQADAKAALAGHERPTDAAVYLARIAAVAEEHPNHVLAQNWYGSALIENCRHEEGLAQRRLAVQLDPLSTIAHLSLGLELARRGRPDEALVSLGRALELDPEYADAHGIVGWTYLHQGKQADAIAAFERCARLAHDSPRMVARLAHAYGLVGRSDDARRLLRTLEARARTEPIPPIFFPHVYAGLGDADRAFAKLYEAADEGRFLRLNGDPLYVPLYTDPRFAELGRRFNERAPCP